VRHQGPKLYFRHYKLVPKVRLRIGLNSQRKKLSPRPTINKNPRKINYLNWGLPTSHQAIFYNQKYKGDIKYNLNFSTSADYQFTAEIYMRNKLIDVYIINKPIIKFFIGGNSTQKKKELLKDCYNIQKEILLRSNLLAIIDYIRRWLALFFFHTFIKVYKLLRKIIK